MLLDKDTLIAAGGVIVTVLTALGGLFTANQSRKAGEQQQRVTNQVNLTKERSDLIDVLSEQLERVWPRLEAMDNTIGRQRDRISHLEEENEALKKNTTECTDRINLFERQLNDYERRYREAIGYIRALHKWISEHISPNAQLPQLPPSVALTLREEEHE
jgi:chromosome segregation ATPase